MNFLRKLFLGKLTDNNKNGIPDHAEVSTNDRDGDGILDHLEQSIDTNNDGIPDTEVSLQSDPFSRSTHLKVPSTLGKDPTGTLPDITTDMDGDGIPDHMDSHIDVNHDGIDDDIDFDIE